MKVFADLERGFRRACNRRLLMLFWLVPLVPALVIVPAVLAFFADLDQAGFRDEMERGLSPEWLVDVWSRSTVPLGTISLLPVMLVPAGVLVQIFLYGAVLGQRVAGERQALAGPYYQVWQRRTWITELFAHGARLFGRFLRLSLFGFILYWIVFSPVRSALTALVEVAAGDSDRQLAIARLIRDGVILALTGCVSLALDYARIRAARLGSRAMLLRLFEAVIFTGRHSVRVFATSLIAVLPVLLAALALGDGSRWLGASPPSWLLFCYFQAIMLARSFSRLWLLFTEYEIDSDLFRPAEWAEPWLTASWPAARPEVPWNS
ncbi:MAG: hypothetical protein ACR2L2_14590 [Acidobacteriota bacterium]